MNLLANILAFICRAPGTVVEFDPGDEITGPFWYARKRNGKTCITGDRRTARAFTWSAP